MKSRFLVLMLHSLLLSACGYVETEENMPVNIQQQIGKSEQLLESYYSGATIFSADDNKFLPQSMVHGVQVEYHSPDGRSYLWYPRNSKVVTGRWEVRTDSKNRAMLCYLYGRNSYNSVTKQRGGEWECRAGGAAMLDSKYGFVGDPWGLSSGKVPFVIPDKTWRSPELLMQMAGRNPANLNYITNYGELN